MIMLWSSIALLTVGVLAIIILPLLRNRPEAGFDTQRADYDVALYKDQLKEVDRDLERGLLTGEQAEAVRTEIKRKLLNSTDGGKPEKAVSAGTSRRNILTAVVMSLFVALGAAGLYSYLGQPGREDLAYADRDIEAERNAMEDGQAEQEMQALLDQLARRLEKNPGDIKGWLLLGRSLIARRRYDESAAAYKHAVDLSPNDPEIAVDYAEAFIFSNKGQVDKETSGVLQKARKMSPADPKILYYIGLYKVQSGDTAGALQDWVDIVALSPDDAPWMPTIHRQIKSAFEASGIDPGSIKPSAEALEFAKAQGITSGITPGIAPGKTTGNTSGATSAPGPTAEDMKAAQQMSGEEQSQMIRGMVARLAEKMKQNPDDIGGWKRLARAYQVLGEKEKAQEALDRIKALENK